MPRFTPEAGLKTAADGGGAPKPDTSSLFRETVQGSVDAAESALSLKQDSGLACAADWKTFLQRAGMGRAVMNLTAPAFDITAAALASPLARGAERGVAREALRAILAPGAIAVAAGSEAKSAEMGGMPSLLAASAGTRAAVLTPAVAARAYLSAGSAGAEAPPVTGRTLTLSKLVLHPSKGEAVADAAMPGKLRFVLANWIEGESALSSKPVRYARPDPQAFG